MDKSAGDGPGLDDSGSQEAGDSDNESQGTASAVSGCVTNTASSKSSSSSSFSSAAGGRSAEIDIRAIGVVAATLGGAISGMMLL